LLVFGLQRGGIVNFHFAYYHEKHSKWIKDEICVVFGSSSVYFDVISVQFDMVSILSLKISKHRLIALRVLNDIINLDLKYQ
jgi:hypothetical protein